MKNHSFWLYFLFLLILYNYLYQIKHNILKFIKFTQVITFQSVPHSQVYTLLNASFVSELIESVLYTRNLLRFIHELL